MPNRDCIVRIGFIAGLLTVFGIFGNVFFEWFGIEVTSTWENVFLASILLGWFAIAAVIYSVMRDRKLSMPAQLIAGGAFLVLTGYGVPYIADLFNFTIASNVSDILGIVFWIGLFTVLTGGLLAVRGRK